MGTESSLLNKARLLIAHPDADVAARRQMVGDFETAVLTCPEADAERAFAQLSPFFPELNTFYEQFETELEIDFSANLSSSKFDVRLYRLYDRFFTLISNEVALAGFGRGDSIVMIGSGPFPISAIVLHTIFGIHVIALDRNSHATELSRRVVRRLGLENGIRVETGTGQDFIDQSVSGAIIALLARQKEEILRNISENYNQCKSVICRTSHGLRRALYRPTDPAILKPYSIRGTQRATADQTISSILLDFRNGNSNYSAGLKVHRPYS